MTIETVEVSQEKFDKARAAVERGEVVSAIRMLAPSGPLEVDSIDESLPPAEQYRLLIEKHPASFFMLVQAFMPLPVMIDVVWTIVDPYISGVEGYEAARGVYQFSTEALDGLPAEPGYEERAEEARRTIRELSSVVRGGREGLVALVKAGSAGDAVKRAIIAKFAIFIDAAMTFGGLCSLQARSGGLLNGAVDAAKRHTAMAAIAVFQGAEICRGLGEPNHFPGALRVLPLHTLRAYANPMVALGAIAMSAGGEA